MSLHDPRLARPFTIVAFDWDGTAVGSRDEDAGPLRDLVTQLLRLNVILFVLTGTSFPNVDRQLSAAINDPHKRNLFLATNRGSEVYGFDAQSHPELRWRRVATAEEDRLLTRIAETVRDRVAATTGLDVRVVYDRLNRRKIDLIPLEEWRDPPKSAIGELLGAVERRLRDAGCAGGLHDVFALTERVAREHGLPAARVTSDVKHIEVGLTDKADAIAWMLRALAQPEGIPPEAILVTGDEFGPIAGFPGSDAKMLVPALDGATFVSVGLEPAGAPPGVLHLGGGPPMFRALLASQVTQHERRAPRTRQSAAPNGAPLALPAVPTADPDWLLVEEGFTPVREHEIESLFTVSNGYVGTRGSLAEGSLLSRPATFVAGVFEAQPDFVTVPELVTAPDWTALRVVVDGHVLTLEEGDSLEHRRVLDLRQAIFWRDWRHRDAAGRITHLSFLRLASLADRHALLQSVTITPENYSGHVRLESVPDRSTGNFSAPPPVPPTSGPERTHSDEPDWSRTVRGIQAAGRDVRLVVAAGSQLRTEADGQAARVSDKRSVPPNDYWEWDAKIGETARFDHLVAVHTSRDGPDPDAVASEHLDRLVRAGVVQLVEAHTQAWDARWQTADVQVEGDAAAQRALRFAGYHLISAGNPDDGRVSIGARALTGEAYKGHVFWDTEIFVLPFYVFTDPPTARALLLYRYHTLPAACAKAARLGYRGALYAWESADTGDETTPPVVVMPSGDVVRILTGEQEHHISADVAYAVWQYWQTSGDDAFFRAAGAEIVLETARFWASRGQLGPDGRYHIRQVIGPDEYHESVDDNAFTNGLARWNMERGADTGRILAERWPDRWRELAERLALDAHELAEWRRLAAAMETGFDVATGLFEQFRGYFDLEEIDVAAYEPRSVPMDVLLGRERTQRSQVIKQADVVALVALLWEQLPPSVREANFRYYEPRTGHGSSLSPAAHALVAARLGAVGLAQRYFHQAADIDLANNMGNAAGGVHIAALGGLWQAAVLGMAGLRLRSEGLALDPHLLPSWHTLQFTVLWREHALAVRITAAPLGIDVRVHGASSMPVGVLGGPELVARAGQHYVLTRNQTGWGEWRQVQA